MEKLNIKPDGQRNLSFGEVLQNKEGISKEEYEKEKMGFANEIGVLKPEDLVDITRGKDGIWRFSGKTLEEYKEFDKEDPVWYER